MRCGAPAGEEAILVPVSVGKRVAQRLAEAPSSEMGCGDMLKLVELEERACARDRIEVLVNRRDYSERELVGKLLADGFSPQVVQAAVGRASEAGVVDDARFAQAFVRSKALCGWGRSRIERELERRGVSLELVRDDVEEELGEQAELGRARSVALRKAASGRCDYPKLVRFLAGRGFSYGVATQAAREALDGSSVFD